MKTKTSKRNRNAVSQRRKLARVGSMRLLAVLRDRATLLRSSMESYVRQGEYMDAAKCQIRAQAYEDIIRDHFNG